VYSTRCPLLVAGNGRSTWQAIADRLNAEGVPTQRGGAGWRVSTVQRLYKSHHFDRQAAASVGARGSGEPYEANSGFGATALGRSPYPRIMSVTFDNVIWTLVGIALLSSFFVRGRFERYAAYSWAARSLFFLGVLVVAAVRGAWLVVAIAGLGAALTSRWARLWWGRYRGGWS